jgi:hypothetical protein
MSIRAIVLHGSRIGASPRPRERVVEGLSAGRGPDRQPAGSTPRPSPEVPAVSSGPASSGPRVRLDLAPGFVTQLAAAGVAGLATGDRRSVRDPGAVLGRADAAYRGAIRLTTALEPGFLVSRSV